jgi:hypothetical protein
MQIHELTRLQPLNELDIVGPGGLISGAKAAYGALKQKGGVKDALRTATPGQGQGFASTADLVQSDFAKRMQNVKNNAAMKQVAANLQKQWNQYKTTVSPMAQISPQQQAQQQALKSQLLAKKVSGGPATAKLPLPGTSAAPTPAKPTAPKFNAPPGYNASNITSATKPITVGKGQRPLDPKNPNDAALIARIQKAQSAVTTESLQLAEAAGVIQLTDWYKKTIIPKSMSEYEAEYLKNPVIQKSLKDIIATDGQPKDQLAAFVNLVAATGAEGQVIAAKQPQAAAKQPQAAPSAAAPQAAGVQAATSQLQKLAGLSATQIDALKKIFSGAPQVKTTDPNTANFLQALGIKTS